MLPADNHVHTNWSWDTASSSRMELACARAVEMGLPGIAFTEHLDFTDWGPATAAADRCRCPPAGGGLRRDRLLG